MVLQIRDALDVPRRNRNEMLRAANYESRFLDPTLNEALNDHLRFALNAMLSHHGPCPMIVFDRAYNFFGPSTPPSTSFPCCEETKPRITSLSCGLANNPKRLSKISKSLRRGHCGANNRKG
ncbi:MAG: hypothetical protein ACU84Q_06535 [Gammaproteobacteria bacterium]